MKILQTIAVLLAMLFAAVTLIPAALAVSWGYPSMYGQPRIGAYWSVTLPNQGMYDYIAPPTALTRYGAQYQISNIRQAVYPRSPYTYSANLYRPYFGYPYGTGNYRLRIGTYSNGVLGGVRYAG